MLQAMWEKKNPTCLQTHGWICMEKRKISYFNCFIPTATQHYPPEYELKYQLVCTRNKKKNTDILTRMIYLKMCDFFFCGLNLWFLNKGFHDVEV